MDVVVPESQPQDALKHPLVQALLNACFDCAIVVDAKTRIILKVNTQAEVLLGYKESEIQGCRCDTTLQTSLCGTNCPLDCQDGGDSSQESQVLCKGGFANHSVAAKSKMILVRDTKGDAVIGIEIFRDLTQVQALEQALERRSSLDSLIGRSSPMQAIYTQVEELANYIDPVLITGENGSGRGHIAEVIHKISSRRNGPLIRFSCTTLSPDLLESALFGYESPSSEHVPGSRVGALELANHGTLLLEEVDALSPYLQGRIALILQEGQVQRMKTTRARPVNFRLIVTASCPHDGQPMLSPALETAVQSHQLKVPPLRERRDDISLLGDQMLDELHREQLAPDRSEQRPHLTEEALRKLMAHTWPGNIAELSLVIREAHLRLRAPEHAIDAELIELRPVEPRTLADAEWTTIEKAMEHTRGNLSAAARVLGIDRTTLWRKLKKRSEVYQASSSS